jgi:hypothetical protein
MKRVTKPLITTNQEIASYSALVARMNLATKLGSSYGGDRDLYQALGYKKDLTFDDYYGQFTRQDMAKAIIDRPVKATWRGDLHLIESNDDKETQLETAWDTLNDDLKLKSKFVRLDRLTGLGNYAVLLLGVNDVKEIEDFNKPVVAGKKNKLLYVKPVSQKNIEIIDYVEDVGDARYGLPKTYGITLAMPGGTTTASLRIHHTRVIHVVDDLLESEVEGIPRLEVVFNRLQDLEKLVGGSAEMFWRGARPGYTGTLDKDYKLTPTQETALLDQVDEYEHNLRRILLAEGYSLTALQQQVSDPKNHVDVQIMMISAVTGIPKRILTGSERAELASTQDKDEWISWVKNRREESSEPQIVRPFVDWCITYGILPKPKEDYDVKWDDLFSQSEEEKAKVGLTRASALKEYVQNAMAESIIPPDAFREYFLGLSKEQMEVIAEMVKEQEKKEDEEMAQLEEEMKQQGFDQQGNPIEQPDNTTPIQPANKKIVKPIPKKIIKPNSNDTSYIGE